MEEYRDLHLTIAVFTRLLEQPKMQHLEAGIVLQAYLPDAVAALESITGWAHQRRAAGGAGIKVRIVKGANLAMERVDATIHDWPLATWSSKQESDTNYKRMLVRALTPENTAVVRIGVAGHNLFDLAFAWLLAERRGVTGRVEIEMLLGMAAAQAEAVRATTGGLLLYTPVVHPEEFDAAISYLVRRLEENASSDNFMSGLFELDDAAIYQRERDRFSASLADLDLEVPAPRRTQDRLHPGLPVTHREFENEPDTDPALAVNREWARGILARSATSKLGVGAIAAARVPSEEALRAIVATSARAGEIWGKVPGTDRGELLDRIGEVLSVFRGRLIEVMASETGKTVAEADVEVSEVIDFAHYYAARARELAAVDGAVFVPVGVTVVTPPWNFPVAIPGGGVLSALAAGSAVLFKPARQARRSRRRARRGDLGGRCPARAGDSGRRLGARPRAAADHRAGGRPRHPDRELRDGGPVPLVEGRPASARGDERQERHHRDPERRPRPRGRRRREERVRQRRAEVLGGIARDPGRVGRDVGALPSPACGCGDESRGRVSAGSGHPDGSGRRTGRRQARARAHRARRGRGVARPAALAGRHRQALVAGCARRRAARQRVPPDRVLRPGARHHDREDPG